jgi:hypothetical protein
MINSLNQLFFSISLPFRMVSIFFLVLLFGFFVIEFGWHDQVNVHGSIDCDLQTSASVDCPTSSGEVETNDDDDDSGNIEDQIPSVIPFP